MCFFYGCVVCVCVTSHRRTTDQTYSLIAWLAGLPSNPCWDDNLYMKRVFSDENGGTSADFHI